MPDDTNNPATPQPGAPPAPPEPSILNDPHRQSSDAKLVRRALRERWAIRDDVRSAISGKLSKMAIEEKDQRKFIAVVKTMLEMDRLNNQLILASVDQGEDTAETKVIELPEWAPAAPPKTATEPEGGGDGSAGGQG